MNKRGSKSSDAISKVTQQFHEWMEFTFTLQLSQSCFRDSQRENSILTLYLLAPRGS